MPAHGIDWMALQTLTDKHLEQPVKFNGNDMKLGDLLPMFLIGHEQMHVQQALAAAGVAGVSSGLSTATGTERRLTLATSPGATEIVLDHRGDLPRRRRPLTHKWAVLSIALTDYREFT